MQRLMLAFLLCLFVAPQAFGGSQDFGKWQRIWPNTDFTKYSVYFSEIGPGGPPKDGIPSIDAPNFVPVDFANHLIDEDPVVSVIINGEARAYPLQILIWHEIVNDTVGDAPISVTYAPLGNSAVVFERRLNGRVLEFGTTGYLRYADAILYDRQTESWWQQFTGEAIVGEFTGERLKVVPARVESVAKFRERAPHGMVLVPSDRELRAYGYNPYAGIESENNPGTIRDEGSALPAPFERVVSIGDEAWTLRHIRNQGKVFFKDLVITWEPGQKSALDHERIADDRDVGNLLVQRRTKSGFEETPHIVSFAFAFEAFYPDGVIHDGNKGQNQVF